jgi:hypothetical protein
MEIAMKISAGIVRCANCDIKQRFILLGIDGESWKMEKGIRSGDWVEDLKSGRLD